MGDFQREQCHLVLKDDHTRPDIWSQKEGVSGTKHFFSVPLYGIHHYSLCFYIGEVSTKTSNGIFIDSFKRPDTARFGI